jgi:hypothetical protein
VEDILSIVKTSQNTSVAEEATDRLIARTDPDMIHERVFLRISVYMIYCDRIFDLLAKQQTKIRLEQYLDPVSQAVVTRFANISEKLVLSLEQYYSAM